MSNNLSFSRYSSTTSFPPPPLTTAPPHPPLPLQQQKKEQNIPRYFAFQWADQFPRGLPVVFYPVTKKQLK